MKADLKDFYGFIIGKTSTAVSRSLLRNLRSEGLNITVEQWSVLYLLWEKDGRTQQELCEGTFKDKPSITRLIDNLQGQGLVDRTADSADRRINLIYLSAKGKQIKSKSLKAMNTTLAQALTGISENQLKIYRSVLAKIFDNLS